MTQNSLQRDLNVSFEKNEFSLDPSSLVASKENPLFFKEFEEAESASKSVIDSLEKNLIDQERHYESRILTLNQTIESLQREVLSLNELVAQKDKEISLLQASRDSEADPLMTGRSLLNRSVLSENNLEPRRLFYREWSEVKIRESSLYSYVKKKVDTNLVRKGDSLVRKHGITRVSKKKDESIINSISKPKKESTLIKSNLNESSDWETRWERKWINNEFKEVEESRNLIRELDRAFNQPMSLTAPMKRDIISSTENLQSELSSIKSDVGDMDKLMHRLRSNFEVLERKIERIVNQRNELKSLNFNLMISMKNSQKIIREHEMMLRNSQSYSKDCTDANSNLTCLLQKHLSINASSKEVVLIADRFLQRKELLPGVNTLNVILLALKENFKRLKEKNQLLMKKQPSIKFSPRFPTPEHDSNKENVNNNSEEFAKNNKNEQNQLKAFENSPLTNKRIRSYSEMKQPFDRDFQGQIQTKPVLIGDFSEKSSLSMQYAELEAKYLALINDKFKLEKEINLLKSYCKMDENPNKKPTESKNSMAILQKKSQDMLSYIEKMEKNKGNFGEDDANEARDEKAENEECLSEKTQILMRQYAELERVLEGMKCESEKALRESQTKYSILMEEYENLKRRLASMEEERGILTNELGEKMKEAEENGRKIKEAEDRIADLQAKMRDLEEEYKNRERLQQAKLDQMNELVERKNQELGMKEGEIQEHQGKIQENLKKMEQVKRELTEEREKCSRLTEESKRNLLEIEGIKVKLLEIQGENLALRTQLGEKNKLDDELKVKDHKIAELFVRIESLNQELIEAKSKFTNKVQENQEILAESQQTKARLIECQDQNSGLRIEIRDKSSEIELLMRKLRSLNELSEQKILREMESFKEEHTKPSMKKSCVLEEKENVNQNLSSKSLGPEQFKALVDSSKKSSKFNELWYKEKQKIEKEMIETKAQLEFFSKAIFEKNIELESSKGKMKAYSENIVGLQRSNEDKSREIMRVEGENTRIRRDFEELRLKFDALEIKYKTEIEGKNEKKSKNNGEFDFNHNITLKILQPGQDADHTKTLNTTTTSIVLEKDPKSNTESVENDKNIAIAHKIGDFTKSATTTIPQEKERKSMVENEKAQKATPEEKKPEEKKKLDVRKLIENTKSQLLEVKGQFRTYQEKANTLDLAHEKLLRQNSSLLERPKVLDLSKTEESSSTLINREAKPQDEENTKKNPIIEKSKVEVPRQSEENPMEKDGFEELAGQCRLLKTKVLSLESENDRLTKKIQEASALEQEIVGDMRKSLEFMKLQLDKFKERNHLLGQENEGLKREMAGLKDSIEKTAQSNRLLQEKTSLLEQEIVKLSEIPKKNDKFLQTSPESKSEKESKAGLLMEIDQLQCEKERLLAKLHNLNADFTLLKQKIIEMLKDNFFENKLKEKNSRNSKLNRSLVINKPTNNSETTAFKRNVSPMILKQLPNDPRPKTLDEMIKRLNTMSTDFEAKLAVFVGESPKVAHDSKECDARMQAYKLSYETLEKRYNELFRELEESKGNLELLREKEAENLRKIDVIQENHRLLKQNHDDLIEEKKAVEADGEILRNLLKERNDAFGDLDSKYRMALRQADESERLIKELQSQRIDVMMKHAEEATTQTEMNLCNQSVQTTDLRVSLGVDEAVQAGDRQQSDKILQTEEDLEKLIEEISMLKARIIEKDKEILRLSESIESNRKLHSAESENTKLKLLEALSNKDSLEAKIRALNSEIDALNHKFSKEFGLCTTKYTLLEEKYKEILDKNTELNDLTISLRKKAQILEVERTTLHRQFKESLEKNHDLEARLISQQALIESLGSETASLRADLSSLQARNAELETETTTLQSTISKLDTRKAELAQKYEELLAESSYQPSRRNDEDNNDNFVKITESKGQVASSDVEIVGSQLKDSDLNYRNLEEKYQSLFLEHSKMVESLNEIRQENLALQRSKEDLQRALRSRPESFLNENSGRTNPGIMELEERKEEDSGVLREFGEMSKSINSEISPDFERLYEEMLIKYDKVAKELEGMKSAQELLLKMVRNLEDKIDEREKKCNELRSLNLEIERKSQDQAQKLMDLKVTIQEKEETIIGFLKERRKTGFNEEDEEYEQSLVERRTRKPGKLEVQADFDETDHGKKFEAIPPKAKLEGTKEPEFLDLDRTMKKIRTDHLSSKVRIRDFYENLLSNVLHSFSVLFENMLKCPYLEKMESLPFFEPLAQERKVTEPLRAKVRETTEKFGKFKEALKIIAGKEAELLGKYLGSKGQKMEDVNVLSENFQNYKREVLKNFGL